MQNSSDQEPTGTDLQPTESVEKSEIPQPEQKYPQKEGKSKIRIFSIIVVALIVGISVAVAVWFVKNRDKPEPKVVSSADTSITIPGGKEIPEINCDDAKARVGPNIFGDKCYEAEFAIGGETVTYVVIAQSEEDYQQREATCEIDCGSDFGGLSRADFVIRANGDVENIPDWGLLADISVEQATGCGGLSFYDLDDTGEKLVKKDGRIGVGYHIQNKKFKDTLGNSCTISTEFSTFVIEPGTVFDSLRVDYDLTELASCEKKLGLAIQRCYQTQAALRNDITLCSKADLGPRFHGNAACISDVATRRRDSSYCGQITDDAQKSRCEEDVTELTEEFKNAQVVFN